MTTLFSEIQKLFERTYASIGVNLEDCLIDSRRCHQLSALAGAQCAELSMLARTFLREADGALHVGIYYSGWLVEQLEKHDPRGGLSGENINPLIMFVEEINHALHAVLRFRAGEHPSSSEEYARNLELQGSVDTYLVLLLFMAFFRRPGTITANDRKWLRFHMFSGRNGMSFTSENLRSRYLETTMLAKSYTLYLESLSAASRIQEIRVFHALDYTAKKERITDVSASVESEDLDA